MRVRKPKIKKGKKEKRKKKKKKANFYCYQSSLPGTLAVSFISSLHELYLVFTRTFLGWQCPYKWPTIARVLTFQIQSGKICVLSNVERTKKVLKIKSTKAIKQVSNIIWHWSQRVFWFESYSKVIGSSLLCRLLIYSHCGVLQNKRKIYAVFFYFDRLISFVIL